MVGHGGHCISGIYQNPENGNYMLMLVSVAEVVVALIAAAVPPCAESLSSSSNAAAAASWSMAANTLRARHEVGDAAWSTIASVSMPVLCLPHLCSWSKNLTLSCSWIKNLPESGEWELCARLAKACGMCTLLHSISCIALRLHTLQLGDLQLCCLMLQPPR